MENILVGVHNVNDIEWMWEESSINVVEERCISCEKDGCEGCENEDVESDDYFYGDWIYRKGLYHVDEDGEYSAIHCNNNFVVQVFKSKYIIKCALCSPCFPNQGDVDTPGDFWAYCLPPELMREEWVKENIGRIKEIK
jgi:hypothetical protein